MKKVLSLIAALSLTLSMSATVFAAEETGPAIGDVTKNNTRDISITAQYTKGENKIPTVYNVTVSWEKTGNLQYTVGSDTYDWQTDSLTYKTTRGTGEWTGKTAQVNITVTNRSNAAVKASVSVTSPSSVTLTDEKPAYVVVPTAAKGLTEPGEAQSMGMVYKITDVSGTIDQDTAIATLTVKIEAAN